MSVFQKYGINPDLSGFQRGGIMAGIGQGLSEGISAITKAILGRAQQQNVAETMQSWIESGGTDIQSASRLYSLGLDPYDVLVKAMKVEQAMAGPDRTEAIKNFVETIVPLAKFSAEAGVSVPFEGYAPLFEQAFPGSTSVPVRGNILPDKVMQSEPPVAKQLWEGLVKRYQQDATLEQGEKTLEFQRKALEVAQLAEKPEKEILSDAIEFMKDSIKMALQTDNPAVAQSLLSVGSLPPPYHEALVKAGFLRPDTTSLIDVADSYISSIANDQERQKVKEDLQIEQMKAQIEHTKALTQKAFVDMTSEKQKAPFSEKDIFNLTEDILYGTQSSNIWQTFGFNRPNVGRGFLTRYLNKEFKSGDEVMAAYETEGTETFIRSTMGDEVNNRIKETLRQSLLRAGATFSSGAGVAPIAEELQNIKATLRNLPPQQVRETWASRRNLFVDKWNQAGMNGEAMAKEIDDFISTLLSITNQGTIF